MFGPPISLIIFDLDGTLVNSGEAVADAFNSALRRKGYAEAPTDAICATIGHPLEAMFAPYLPPGQRPDEMVELYRTRYQEIYLEKTHLLPGVADALPEFAAKGWDLAVATTKPRYFTEPILENLGVLKYFKAIAGAEDVENLKPAPDILQHVMNMMGRNPIETLFVGDTTVDIEAARAVRRGLRIACVLTGHCDEATLREAGPDLIYPDLPALLDDLTAAGDKGK